LHILELISPAISNMNDLACYTYRRRWGWSVHAACCTEQCWQTTDRPQLITTDVTKTVSYVHVSTVLILQIMFMALSSWESHYRSCSSGSPDQCRRTVLTVRPS